IPQADSIPVATNRSGRAMAPRTVGEAFTRWRDAAGFTMNFHVLRHTTASLMLVSGTDIVTVAGILGDTVSTIQRTYAHFLPSADVMAAQRLDALMRDEKVVTFRGAAASL